ncbi:MAG TPA: lysoplasmalogenase [Acidimicrobiia bacterium]|nr:lysoplasmalogenase [Acidimicrobiia bacterium]
MTKTTVAFMGLAGINALVDWWAVAGRRRRLEYVLKPGVMVWLTAAALSIDSGATTSTHVLFVAALVFSLAGDVFLMLERERFVAGLASFLLAHLCYAAGLAAAPSFRGAWLAIGYAIVVGPAAIVGWRIAVSVHRDDPGLLGPVLAYIGVISTMVAFAIATGHALAIAGAGLFYLSDALLAWSRFITSLRGGSVAVIVTYHLGQGLLVVSLASL